MRSRAGQEQERYSILDIDCLDIANRQFQIVGKFLFQINWRVGQPQQIYNYSPNLLIK